MNQTTNKKSKTETPAQRPNLRIVTAEELNTAPAKPRHRSALVQQFLQFSDQLDEDINRILNL